MFREKDTDRYADIIGLPRHISNRRPHMSIHDRAAQFAPFAALTGHGAAIDETARYVDSKIIRGEDAVAENAEKLNYIRANIRNGIYVNITYFVPDSRKNGGRYETVSGTVTRIDNTARTVKISTGRNIGFDDILAIEL